MLDSYRTDASLRHTASRRLLRSIELRRIACVQSVAPTHSPTYCGVFIPFSHHCKACPTHTYCLAREGGSSCSSHSAGEWCKTILTWHSRSIQICVSAQRGSRNRHTKAGMLSSQVKREELNRLVKADMMSVTFLVMVGEVQF